MNSEIFDDHAVFDPCACKADAHVLAPLPNQPRAPSTAALWRKKHAQLLVGVAGMGLLAGVHSLRAETYTWIGVPSAAWNNSANWRPTGLPSIGDEVVIGQSRAVVVDAQATGNIHLVTGGLTIDPTGQLTFQFVDLIAQDGNTGSMTNHGVVTGSIGTNEGGIQNSGSWGGDVHDNINTLYNHDSWDGAVHLNRGTLVSRHIEGGTNRPQWLGDVLLNEGTLIQDGGDWVGIVGRNVERIESRLDSTWTGDIWENSGDILNMDSSTWTGDIFSNSGYIDNYDLEGIWNGDVRTNSKTIWNGGIWNGDILENNGFIGNYYPESIWNGDVRANTDTIFNGGVWNGLLTNSGTISNELGGVWTGDINSNDGTITSDDGAIWHGDVLGNNSIINNLAGSQWSGDIISNGDGSDTLAAIFNRGLWTGEITSNSGFIFNDGGVWDGDIVANALSVANTGNWTGDIHNNDSQITNEDGGAWSGDILGNNDAIINVDGGVWKGDVIANDGGSNILTQIVNEGDWTGDVQTNARTIYNVDGATWNGDVLANAGAIVTSGVWNGDFSSAGLVLAEGVINGAFTNSGQLSVTGSLTGITTLTNTGIIRMNGGSGTLTVDGDLTFNSGSTYEIEIDPTGAASDLIMVLGTAHLNGGSVVHIGEAGTYRPESDYTILSATGGVVGAFDGVTSNYVFLDPTLIHNLNDVVLRLVRNDVGFASIGTTANQQATANALDSLGLGVPLYDAITILSGSQAPGAFDQLSGEIHASGSTALINNSSKLRSIIMNRINSVSGDQLSQQPPPLMAYAEHGSVMDLPPANRHGAWGHVYGSWGSTSTTINTAALRQDEGGLLVGADGRFDDVWYGGLFGGYSRSSFSVADRSSSGTSINYHLGIYGAAELGAVYLNASAVHSWHGVDTARNVAFPGFTDTLTASYRARTMQVFGEAGYRTQMNGMELKPFAGLAHVHLSTNGFTESGGNAALTAAASTNASTFSTLGIRVASESQLGGLKATARGMVGWRHAFGEATPTSSLAFAGSDSFAISGAPITRNAAVVELGLDLGIGRNANLGISYDGQFGRGSHAHSANVRLEIAF